MPGIVDPDQNTDQIRLQIQSINLPAGIQIDDTVAADAAIVKSPIHIRSVTKQTGSNHPCIAGTESVIVITCAAAGCSTAIGDGITLKKDRKFVSHRASSFILKLKIRYYTLSALNYKLFRRFFAIIFPWLVNGNCAIGPETVADVQLMRIRSIFIQQRYRRCKRINLAFFF